MNTIGEAARGLVMIKFTRDFTTHEFARGLCPQQNKMAPPQPKATCSPIPQAKQAIGPTCRVECFEQNDFQFDI